MFVWRKGSATIKAEIEGDRVLVVPCIGDVFTMHLEAWNQRREALESEGWVLDPITVTEADFSPSDEEESGVRSSGYPTVEMPMAPIAKRMMDAIPKAPKLPTGVEVPADLWGKILLPADAVLRRRGATVYIMASKSDGWDTFGFPALGTDADIAVKFNIRLGDWSADEHGDFCPISKVTHKVVLRPPRPGKVA